MKERTFYKDERTKLYNNMDSIQPKAYFIDNSIKLMIITAVLCGLSVFINSMNVDISVIILIFMMIPIMTVTMTDGVIFGVVSAVASVFLFDFIFMEPLYGFSGWDRNYTIMFIGMFIFSCISTAIVSKLKLEIESQKLKARKMEMLYKTDKMLLRARNKEQIMESSGENLVNILGKTILITLLDENRNLMEPHVYICNSNGSENIFRTITEREIIKECFRRGCSVGVGTKFYGSSNAHYEPIKGNYSTLGVIGVACFKKEILSEDEVKILKVVAEQVSVAIERENIFERRHLANIEGEEERLVEKIRRVTGGDYVTLDDFLYDNSPVNSGK